MDDKHYKDLAETDPDLRSKLDEAFDQKLRKVKDIFRDMGPDGELRILTPKKDAHTKGVLRK